MSVLLCWETWCSKVCNTDSKKREVRWEFYHTLSAPSWPVTYHWSRNMGRSPGTAPSNWSFRPGTHHRLFYGHWRQYYDYYDCWEVVTCASLCPLSASQFHPGFVPFLSLSSELIGIKFSYLLIYSLVSLLFYLGYCLLYLWESILKRINEISKYLIQWVITKKK